MIKLNSSLDKLLRKFFKISAIVFMVSLTSVIFTACHKSENLGQDLVNPKDYYNHRYLEYKGFKSSTLLDDSVQTDENTSEVNFLGAINDEKFGELKASFATQFTTPLGDIDTKEFIDNNVSKFDSVVLSLSYNNNFYYGKLTGEENKQRVQVYSLINPIESNKLYYNTTNLSNFIGTNPPLLDTTFNFNQISNSTLKLKFPVSYFNTFILPQNLSTLLSSEALKSFFKGLGFRTNNSSQAVGTGNICSFDLKSVNTKLTLHYHIEDTVKKSVSLIINSNCRRLNIFSSSKEEKLASLKADEQNIYLQGFSTYNGFLYAPINEIFKDSLPVAIVNAQLELPVNTELFSTSTDKPFPAKLELVFFDEDSTRIPLIDVLQTDSYAPNGTYNSTTSSYVFNVTRTMQNIISGNEKIKGFLITCGSRNISPRKVILKGENNINLKIKYTKFRK